MMMMVMTSLMSSDFKKMDVGAVGAEKCRSHSVQKNLKPMLCEKLDKKRHKDTNYTSTYVK